MRFGTRGRIAVAFTSLAVAFGVAHAAALAEYEENRGKVATLARVLAARLHDPQLRAGVSAIEAAERTLDVRFRDRLAGVPRREPLTPDEERAEEQARYELVFPSASPAVGRGLP